jgi:hypothetical protein
MSLAEQLWAHEREREQLEALRDDALIETFQRQQMEEAARAFNPHHPFDLQLFGWFR